MSLFIQWLPMFEVLFFNLLNVDLCSHRKYSLVQTIIGLLGFTAIFFAIFTALAQAFSFSQGEGRFAIFGFFYLVPFRLLYKEKAPILFVITCSGWSYTMGVLALTFQIVNILDPGNLLCILLVETFLFLLTIFPFSRILVPMYIFVLKHVDHIQTHWYRYLILNSALTFLLLFTLHRTFTMENGSVGKILVILLLLVTIYMSYFILYRVFLDVIKMDQLEKAALEDPLTRLGNRSLLWQDLHQLLEEGQSFSLLFMDLDRFKLINDQYGHLTGDRYLQHFANICSEMFQDSGKVYRFGGDEFVAIYNGSIPPELIQQLKACPQWDDGAPCPFNQVSTGVLHCRPPHSGVDQILQQVDQLMYQNKSRNQGR